MKHLITILFISASLSTCIAFESKTQIQKPDTAITADLNGDGIKETVKLYITRQHDKSGTWISGFEITINDIKTRTPVDNVLSITLKTEDIDKNDKYTEIIAEADMDPDGLKYYIYKFDNSKIYFIGSFQNFFYEDLPPFPGNGKIYTNNWMGFWKLYDTYTYSSEQNTLTRDNTTGIYDVIFPKDITVTIKVTEPFQLHKERDKNSEITASIRKGTVINILKADIFARCKESPEEDLSVCYWYYIESPDGSGWIMLKDFMNNVEGLPWAG